MKRLAVRTAASGSPPRSIGDLARNLEMQHTSVSAEDKDAAATVIFRHFRDDHVGRDEVLSALGLQS